MVNLGAKSDSNIKVIRLFDCINCAEVQAVLRRARFSDIPIWKDWMLGFYGANEADKNWDWAELIQESLLDKESYETYIITYDCKAQGLMHVKKDNGKREVYVEYLCSSPFNRGRHREFAGAGTTLIFKAIELSVKKGFNGIISLASKPNAEGYYEKKLEMEKTGEFDSDGFPVFRSSEKTLEIWRNYYEGRKK
jgi:hypothetical protein